jgi:hypothetical protein
VAAPTRWISVDGSSGSGPGAGVGVDVVGLAVHARADRGDDRHEVLGQQPFDDRRVDRLDITHEPQLRVAGARHDQARVLPRQADGQRAVRVDGRDHVTVDLPHQDHPGDVERRRVGHPEAVAELRLDAEP